MVQTQTVRESILAQSDSIDPNASLRQNAENLGINYNTYRREISQLEKEGLVERTGRGRYKKKEPDFPDPDEVEGMDYDEMRDAMHWYQNYSIIDRKTWHKLWEHWRRAHEVSEYT